MFDSNENFLSAVDHETPNIARMYDYFLGGSANFAIDRAAAEELLEAFPGNTLWAQHNRSFLRRAVRHLCARGIDQFLDLGSGVPAAGNVHEIAQHENPAARVAYVDIEPIAVHHARHMLADNPTATATQADMREPETVLTAPGVAGLLDFTRPVAVLAVAILDIIEVADPPAVLAAYRDACTPGSALVISHSAQLAVSDEVRDGVAEVLAQTTTPQLNIRTAEEIAALLPGYSLLEPGVVPSAAWRPDTPLSDTDAQHSNGYAAVGIR